MRLLVVGAGGHAKVVIDAARAAGMTIAGVVGRVQESAEVLGVPISEDASGIDADAFIIAVGDNKARRALYDEYVAMGLVPAAVVHPSAVIAEGVAIGAGTFVAAGVVVNVDASIGVDAVLNTSCSVDHDCVIGDHAHVGPTSGLCGGVSIGTGALVGVGCSIIPMRSVGDWAVVGAGSVVISDVVAGDTCAGVPARSISQSEV